MAMTKAEKAELEGVRRELALVKAFRFSGMAEPEMMPTPDCRSKELIEGWEMNSHAEGRVSVCTTESGRHWSGRTAEQVRANERSYLSASQNGRSLYRTRIDALKALRLAKEREFAKALADIDRRIAEAESA